MQKALFPGTFDPPTFGHLDAIERSSKLFGSLVVAVGKNSRKTNSLLSEKERLEILKEELSSLPNVEVTSFSGLVTKYAKENEIDVLVRCIRSPQELDFEIEMAAANRMMSGIETFLLTADPKTSRMSSTLIRELASHKAPLRGFVPESALNIIYKED